MPWLGAVGGCRREGMVGWSRERKGYVVTMRFARFLLALRWVIGLVWKMVSLWEYELESFWEHVKEFLLALRWVIELV